MYKHILIPTDGSRLSQRTVVGRVELAQALCAEDGIVRPAARVEGAPRGRNRRVHVLSCAIGGGADASTRGGACATQAQRDRSG